MLRNVFKQSVTYYNSRYEERAQEQDQIEQEKLFHDKLNEYCKKGTLAEILNSEDKESEAMPLGTMIAEKTISECELHQLLDLNELCILYSDKPHSRFLSMNYLRYHDWFLHLIPETKRQMELNQREEKHAKSGELNSTQQINAKIVSQAQTSINEKMLVRTVALNGLRNISKLTDYELFVCIVVGEVTRVPQKSNSDLLEKAYQRLIRSSAGQNTCYTHLTLASLFNKLDDVDKLLKEGADVNGDMESFFSMPILYAILNNNEDLTQRLLARQADVRDSDLQLLAKQMGNQNVIRNLEQALASYTTEFKVSPATPQRNKSKVKSDSLMVLLNLFSKDEKTKDQFDFISDKLTFFVESDDYYIDWSMLSEVSDERKKWLLQKLIDQAISKLSQGVDLTALEELKKNIINKTDFSRLDNNVSTKTQALYEAACQLYPQQQQKNECKQEAVRQVLSFK